MAVKNFVKTRDGDLDGQEEVFIVNLADHETHARYRCC